MNLFTNYYDPTAEPYIFSKLAPESFKNAIFDYVNHSIAISSVFAEGNISESYVLRHVKVLLIRWHLLNNTAFVLCEGAINKGS